MLPPLLQLNLDLVICLPSTSTFQTRNLFCHYSGLLSRLPDKAIVIHGPATESRRRATIRILWYLCAVLNTLGVE